MMRSLQTVALLLIAILIPYAGTYVWLSWHGRYEPGAIGLSGVKWYEWAPQGFVDDGYQREFRLWLAYLPLVHIDRSCWHPPLHSSQVASTRYPVNEVDNVGVLYRAWGLTSDRGSQ